VTALDVETLQKALSQKISSAGVITSQDAGDYICNYMFFRGCQLAAEIEDHDEFEIDCAATFVHVPAFTTVKQSVQTDFLHQLIQHLPKTQFVV